MKYIFSLLLLCPAQQVFSAAQPEDKDFCLRMVFRQLDQVPEKSESAFWSRSEKFKVEDYNQCLQKNPASRELVKFLIMPEAFSIEGLIKCTANKCSSGEKIFNSSLYMKSFSNKLKVLYKLQEASIIKAQENEDKELDKDLYEKINNLGRTE